MFTPAAIRQMQTGITAIIIRIACGFLMPSATSCPELPFAERLEGVAQLDRAYTVVLVHGICGDAHHDPRLAGLTAHPRLLAAVMRRMAPRQITDQRAHLN